MRGLSLVAASVGHSSLRCVGLSLSRPLLLQSTGSRRAGSVVVAHRPSCSTACGIFPDQGSNLCSLHWQADSQPLRHQGRPGPFFFTDVPKQITPPRTFCPSHFPALICLLMWPILKGSVQMFLWEASWAQFHLHQNHLFSNSLESAWPEWLQVQDSECSCWGYLGASSTAPLPLWGSPKGQGDILHPASVS